MHEQELEIPTSPRCMIAWAAIHEDCKPTYVAGLSCLKLDRYNTFGIMEQWLSPQED